MNQNKTNYKLLNVLSNRTFDDSGWLLSDPQGDKPSLIRAIYDKKQIEFKNPSKGIYKYSDWLPITRELVGSSAPVTYKSDGLSKCLGLNNLYITFSGYYPTRGATMKSCSFKETEAYSVCGRMTGEMEGVMVVSSAGNTARAFAKVCSENKIPIVITIPYDNIEALWFDAPLDSCVKIFATESGSDYFDAISLGNEIIKNNGFYAEGGATNVARRDGMATTYLSAVEFIGKLPDFYFQAVGSGTGAIAAWEANQRFIEDGRFGDKKTKLILSQNSPFLIIKDSWDAKSRELLEYDANQAREDAVAIDAKVLSNRKPPYSVHGGLFDALIDTDGEMTAATNEDIEEMKSLFKKQEEIDIHAAAAVAVKSLIDFAKDGKVSKDDIIMLNITGGGEELFKSENKIYYAEINHVFPINFTAEEVTKVLNSFFI